MIDTLIGVNVGVGAVVTGVGVKHKAALGKSVQARVPFSPKLIEPSVAISPASSPIVSFVPAPSWNGRKHVRRSRGGGGI